MAEPKPTEYPFLTQFNVGDFVRVNNTNYKVTINKRTNKKELTKKGVISPSWANNITTYYDKDGAYHFKDGIKQRGVKKGSTHYNINVSNKTQTNNFKRYQILQNVDRTKNYKVGGYGGQPYEDFLKEVERKNYGEKELKQIYERVFRTGTGASRQPSTNYSKFSLDRAYNAKRLLKTQGIETVFKDNTSDKLTWTPKQSGLQIENKNISKSETDLLTQYPYLSAKDLYIPQTVDAFGEVTPGKDLRNDPNALASLNSKLMIQSIGEYSNQKPTGYESSVDSTSTIGQMSQYTKEIDTSYEGIVARKKEKAPLPINQSSSLGITDSMKRRTGMSDSELRQRELRINRMFPSNYVAKNKEKLLLGPTQWWDLE